MRSSQHWKHRLKKKFGMGKQSKLTKKFKYAQVEATKFMGTGSKTKNNQHGNSYE
tara:strand:+ start:242 stop:406 length:165 start_codon:yes stop_codon:yes gene_type:complete